MTPWRGNKLQTFSAIFTVRKIDQLGSGWGLVVSADFNSVGSNPSIGAVGSTPSRSRQTADICCQSKNRWRFEITSINSIRVG